MKIGTSIVIVRFILFVVLASALNSDAAMEEYGPSMTILDDQIGFEPGVTCWNTLNCSLVQIESMKMKDRIQFVQSMAERKFGPLASVNQFRAIEGTMDFFVRKGIAGRGTWMSYVNAAAIEAIQRGAAISLGESQSTGGNPATLKWANYFDQRKEGKLVHRDTHDPIWAQAEHTAIEYGIRLAESKPDLETPSPRERRWQQLTKVYRTVMQYRRTLLWFINMAFNFTSPGFPAASQAFIDWFTDVTDATSTGFLADIAWRLCALGLSWSGEDPVQDSEVILQMITEFWEAFQLSRDPSYEVKDRSPYYSAKPMGI